MTQCVRDLHPRAITSSCICQGNPFPPRGFGALLVGGGGGVGVVYQPEKFPPTPAPADCPPIHPTSIRGFQLVHLEVSSF